MDAIDRATDAFGVHLDAQSAAVKAGLVLLLSVGAFTLVKPFFGFVRLLCSLFVLPGQSVRSPHSRTTIPKNIR